MKRLSNEQSTKIFKEAEPILNKIKLHQLTNDEKLVVFMGARFIDIRCRKDGYEYFFEGESIRWYINELESKLNKTTRKKWYKFWK